MANGFTGGGSAMASYPSNGYPGINFLGAQQGIAGRVGVQPQTSGSVRSTIPAAVRKNHVLAVVLVVLGGYAVWHISARIGR